jgi:hypothetical protein
MPELALNAADAERSGDITLRVAILAALFSAIATGVYVVAEREPSPGISWLLSGVPLMAVVLWIEKDTRRTRVARVQDLAAVVALLLGIFGAAGR